MAKKRLAVLRILAVGLLAFATFSPAHAFGANAVGVPTVPQHVTLRLIATRSVMVSWSQPASIGGQSAIAYIVRAKNSNITRTCVTSRLTCTFSSLGTGLMYAFWVIAHNDHGNSRSTAFAYIETIPGAKQQPPSHPPTTTVPKPRVDITAANWVVCNAPVGGTIQFSYSNGTTTQEFVNASGYGGSYPPTYETIGQPGGTTYGYYLVTKDNSGNTIPGPGLALYVYNAHLCSLAP